MEHQSSDTCAVVVDEANKKIFEISKKSLLNQISRDADRIAKSFDDLLADDLEEISKQFAYCMAVLTSGVIRATQDGDDRRIACAELLSNALNSIAASTFLLRGGFVLQPGPVMRSSFESLAVVLHLMQFEDDFQSYRDHTFDSTRAVTSAKRVFPPFGKIYGFLSKEFTHIGRLHKQLTPVREYTRSYEPLELNLQFIRTGVWMSYVTCELVFLDLVGQPRYWQPAPTEVENTTAYRYDPSAEELAWMESFFGTESPA